MTLEGPIPSKKNAWKRGANNVYLDESLTKELDYLLYQILRERNIQKLPLPIAGKIEIRVVFYILKVRYDVDNMYTTLQDLLQKAKVIKNDRMVEEFHVERRISDEEKTEIEIY